MFMTSTNTRSMNDPFLLKPAAKDYLWGGNRLNTEFGKNIDLSPLAETWECSVHPAGESIIASGPFKKRTLRSVLESHPEFMGTNAISRSDLPVLVKFIDADQDLSIQVHPDDAYARSHENGQSGKTELWYILDAEPGATIVYGLKYPLSRNEAEEELLRGDFTKYLNYVPVKKGDVFLIKAGTIHAINHGVLAAEIQESSDLTYRLFDYHRLDKNGKERPLNISGALDVADLSALQPPQQPMHVLHYQRGFATERLCRCPYFQVDRVLLNTAVVRSMVPIQTTNYTFRILLCIDGCGVMRTDEDLFFFKGDCIFIPAGSKPAHLHGSAKFLSIEC